MTNISCFFVFAVLFLVQLSRASSSPGLPHQKNPVREICRRGTDSLERHPTKLRKDTRAYSPANPIRFGSDIFDKLRNAQDAGQQPDGQHPNQSNDQAAKRGEFVSDDPKYLLDDTSSYQQAIKSLQQILKGVQPESGNTPGSANVFKGTANKEQQDFRTKNLRWKKKRFGGNRKKRLGRASRSEKGYLDYTNSQMPFNEGTKRSLKEQEKGSESNEGDSNESNESNYSRVRRFLDQERMRKLIKGSTTLEAKEAAMSRVLDPNLNLDGVLEPHIRKRRYSCRRGMQWNSLG